MQPGASGHLRDGVASHSGTRILRHIGLMLAWLLLWRLSALMEFAPHASLWFPPAGLSFAAFLMLGRRAFPALMASAVIVTFWVDRMYATALPWRELLQAGVLFGLAHCGSYGLGALGLKHLIRARDEVSVPVIVPLFLLVGSLASLGATLTGIVALQTAGMLGAVAIDDLWLPWWVGDMAGVLVLTPLFVGLLSWHYPDVEPWLGGLSFLPSTSGLRAFTGKLALSLAALSLIMLLDAHVHSPEVAFGVFFLIIPQMWIVYTEPPFRSTLSIALFSTLTALWVALLGLIEQSLTYQFALCVIAASGYFGFAVPWLLAQNRRLSERALHDELTGAANRGYFFEYADETLSEVRRRGVPLSLAVLDLDYFKTINDTHGHDVGDRALIGLCAAMRPALDSDDLLGRFGGDEFLLLLPNRDTAQARQLVTRLHQRICDLQVAGMQQRLSATFGVVTLERHETLTQAFKRADIELLKAKQARPPRWR
ncbi:MAG: diguanylate cyclase [Halomonadaceae bacterium T82-2]|nr:MAG: diguanylate cyclase [Halomonadaceae bacterium T82-2]